MANSFDKWRDSCDLTPEDIRRYPVWVTVSDDDVQEAEDDGIEDADDERDEGTVRPKTVFGGGPSKQPVSFDDAAVIGCTIRLGDGSEHVGFVWHEDADEFFGLTLVTDSGHCPIAPTHGLGISQDSGVSQDRVFPIHFETVVEVKEDFEPGAARSILKGVVRSN